MRDSRESSFLNAWRKKPPTNIHSLHAFFLNLILEISIKNTFQKTNIKVRRLKFFDLQDVYLIKL